MTSTSTTRKYTPLALAGAAIVVSAIPACAPPPVRRQPEPKRLVAEPLSVSPELERAPAQPQARASQPPTRQPAGELTAATRDEPDATPPAQTTRPQTQPVTPPPASDDWWLRTPAAVPGRVRLVASATGQTLREARRAAVDQGIADLRLAVRGEPGGVVYELTSVQRDTPGRFRGYVLVSCDEPSPSEPR